MKKLILIALVSFLLGCERTQYGADTFFALNLNIYHQANMVELMVKNWNQLLSKFIFLHKHLQGNL